MRFLTLSLLLAATSHESNLSELIDESCTNSAENLLNRDNYASSANTTCNRRTARATIVNPHSYQYKIALHKVDDGEFTRFYCGGAILSEFSILTAAHCVDRSVVMVVIAGVHNQHIVESSQKSRLARLYGSTIHEYWDPVTRVNDIAIMTVSVKIDFDAFVQPVRLPTEFVKESFIGEEGRLLGWSMTEYGTDLPLLMETYSKIISNHECQKDSDLICVKMTEESACRLGSGGTLTVDRPGNARPVLIGLSTQVHGDSCRIKSTKIGVYTRITSYLEWIIKNH